MMNDEWMSSEFIYFVALLEIKLRVAESTDKIVVQIIRTQNYSLY